LEATSRVIEKLRGLRLSRAAEVVEGRVAMSTAEVVLNVLAQVSRTDAVRENLDIRLFDRHILDSLATVRLIVALEEAFSIQIDDVEFDREAWATPGHIVAFMEQRLGK
jgi:D-alanine--poly(phosphoribitol) ligase subunit 2